MKRKVSKYLCFLTCMLLIMACQHEDDNDTKNFKVPQTSKEVPGVDKTQFNLAKDQTQFTFNIENKGNWTLETDVDWLVPDKNQGDGNTQVVVDCAANTTKEIREGKITITNTASRETTRILVKQDGMPLDTAKLVSYRSTIGNYVKGEKSYIEMTFDKPMTVDNLHFERFSIEQSSAVYSEDRCTVRYEFPAASIGLEADGSVTVASDDGLKMSYNFKFRFYDKRYLVEGEIRDTKTSSDEQSLWIAINNPSKLIEMSLIDGSVLHEIAMPFAPGEISINPYNNQLYVMPASDEPVNKFCMVDPKKGVITNTYTIKSTTKDHPQYPCIYPYELEFTRDGLGILILISNGSTDLGWRYVDSANGNKITVSEYDRSEEYELFEHVYQGCNQKNLYTNAYPQLYGYLYRVSRQQPVPHLQKLDNSFKSTYEFAGGNMMTMVFHRYHNSVFIATAPACQCVVNLDNMSYSKVTSAESRGAKAAWDYSNHSRNLVYYAGGFKSYLFYLLDMDKGDCIYRANCIWGSDEIRTINHLEKTDQVLITDESGVYLISAAGMKK